MRNSVTLERVMSRIYTETFTVLPNMRTTVCQITLVNGFTVEGMSACVAVENFNKELGEKIARENAIHEIWKLEGYLLAEEMFNS